MLKKRIMAGLLRLFQGAFNKGFPTFTSLPDLTRVKSGRASHPARPRGGRSSLKLSTGQFQGAHHPPAGAFRTHPVRRAPIYHRHALPNLPCSPARASKQRPGKLSTGEFSYRSGTKSPHPSSPNHMHRRLPFRAFRHQIVGQCPVGKHRINLRQRRQPHRGGAIQL